jgi:two-component system NtrC family sensor kinase
MLSAGIAHELKNPLAAIAGSLEPGPEILDELETAAAAGRPIVAELGELRSILADCDLATGHLRRIAGELTDLVRTGPAQASAVDPAAVLDSAGRMLKAKSKVPFSLVVRSGSRRPVRVDSGRLLQVLLNLGANAIDAMEGRSHAVLTLATEDAGEDRVVFVVEDTGSGIPDEVFARLYEPFLTTKGPGRGTGLGLHLVSEIVAAHNGRIECSTRIGEGTRFRVDLPAAIEAMTPDGVLPRDEDHVERTQDSPDRGRRGDHPQGVATHAAAGTV